VWITQNYYKGENNMRIMPLTFNLDRTRFTSNNDDIRKAILDSLNDKLSGGFSSGDEFVPATPSQPIIIQKLEIKTGENKGNNVASSIAGGGIGSAGGVGVSKLTEKKQASAPQQEDNKQVDYNKISEEAAQETRDEHSDEINSGLEDIDDVSGGFGDDDSDFDFDDGEE